ncbi:MAG: DUF2567 domain-containing protein [Pseudonocardiaceae bacterium]|nr:DUF2567 domain-containing protein [Pseudonocardiaceae bacterium]
MTDRDVAASAAAETQPRLHTEVSSRAELLPSLRVLGAVAVLGLPLGWLWSLLAPPEVVRVQRGRVTSPLLAQSTHRFDDLAVFLLLGLAAGVLTGAAVWLLRQRRGPVMLVAATAGALAGAWLALHTGEVLAGWRYTGALEAVPVGELGLLAPTVASSWAVVMQPLWTAFAYGAAASWNASDDLGRT